MKQYECFEDHWRLTQNGLVTQGLRTTDITVHGCNQEEHDERLHNVRNMLRHHNLTVNLDKCELNMSHLILKAHVLSWRRIGLADMKVQAVVNASEPKSASEVKNFLRVVTYSSCYIPDFSTVSALLRKPNEKIQIFLWSSEQKTLKLFQHWKTCYLELKLSLMPCW